MESGEPNERRRALRFLLWCLGVAAGAVAVFLLAGQGAGAGAAGFDPLAETALSRGAILDQIEGLGQEAGKAGEPMVVTGRREVAGVGPRRLLIDAPFTIDWMASGGDFAISVRRLEGQPVGDSRPGERPGQRVSSQTIIRLMESVRALDEGDFQEARPGRGRIRQTLWGRYEIRIDAQGPWRLTIRHRWQ